MKFKTNNSFNSTMMVSFLPVIVSKKNKKQRKICLFILQQQCITNSHTYIHTLISLLQDTSVAACEGCQAGIKPSMSPSPLRGTWTREASIHQFLLPIPPSLLLSITSDQLPPLLLGPPSSLLHFCRFSPPHPLPLHLLGLFPSVQFS